MAAGNSLPLFQYQAWAEPYVYDVVAETITSDKWDGRRVDRADIRRRRPVAEGLESFGPIAGPWEEQVQLDKFAPRYPDRLTARPPRPFVGCFGLSRKTRVAIGTSLCSRVTLVVPWRLIRVGASTA